VAAFSAGISPKLSGGDFEWSTSMIFRAFRNSGYRASGCYWNRGIPRTCSCLLHCGSKLILRVKVTRLSSGGWRPSTIASRILGDRNPNRTRRRIERPLTFSRRVRFAKCGLDNPK
jgi:hypothetical protein